MKCGQQKCETEATWKVFWPGQPPLAACDEHMRQLVGTSQAMGFYLAVQQVPTPTPED